MAGSVTAKLKCTGPEPLLNIFSHPVKTNTLKELENGSQNAWLTEKNENSY